MIISMIQAETELFSEGTYSFNEDPGQNETYMIISFYSESTSERFVIFSGTVTPDQTTRNRVKGNFDAYGISQGWGI